MLPFALESVGWGSERCGRERPLEGRVTMLEEHRPISLRLGRAPRVLWRQGRMERRTRRNRRAGGCQTEKVSTVVIDVAICTREDVLSLIQQIRARNPRAFRQKMGKFPRSTCDCHFILVLSSPSSPRLDGLRVSSILSPTMP